MDQVQDHRQVRVYREGDSVHARISGPIAAESLASIQRRLLSSMTPPCRNLTLDLGPAEYINSDGVRWLRRFRDELAPRGVALRIAVREGSSVQRTLRLLGMDTAFDLEHYPADTETLTN